MTKSIVRVAVGTGLILLIPLALQLTIGTGVDGQGFNWGPEDFVAMGILLFVTGLAIEVAMRKLKPEYRLFAIVAVVLLFLLIWADLAVGIFNIPGFSGS